jgi:hypothetical protein
MSTKKLQFESGHGDNIIPPPPLGLVSQSSRTCICVHETSGGIMDHAIVAPTPPGIASIKTQQKKRHINVAFNSSKTWFIKNYIEQKTRTTAGHDMIFHYNHSP